MAESVEQHDCSEPASPAASSPAATSAGTPERSRPIAAYMVAVVGLALIGLLAIFVVTLNRGGETAATPLLNSPAPTARGALADGSAFDLNRRKGSWVVLNFFTPDCVPCIREHPELMRFVDQQRSLDNNGAEFYTVVQHAQPDEVDEFFATYGGGDWPIVYDDQFEFQAGFGVAQVPETWLIDPDGIVRGRVIGEVSDATALSAEIQRMRDVMSGGQ